MSNKDAGDTNIIDKSEHGSGKLIRKRAMVNAEFQQSKETVKLKHCFQRRDKDKPLVLAQ
eukprot:802349-Heterocapsa_arctica.AAC.1